MQSFSTWIFLAWLRLDTSLWAEFLWDFWAAENSFQDIKSDFGKWWCAIVFIFKCLKGWLIYFCDQKYNLQSGNLWKPFKSAVLLTFGDLKINNSVWKLVLDLVQLSQGLPLWMDTENSFCLTVSNIKNELSSSIIHF